MAAKLGSRSKPRQAPKPARSSPTAPPRAGGMGDNSAALEEAERVQLISFISRFDAADIEVERTKAPYDAAKKARASVRKLAEAADFSLEEIDRRRKEMSMAPSEKVKFVARENRHRRWLRVIDDDQIKMHLEPATPIEARDEMDWQSRGYSAGLRGQLPTLPEGIPPRMEQPFLKGHEAGYRDYLSALQANLPKKLEVRDQAAQDFKADNPEVDIAKAAKALAKDPAFMDRTPPPEGEMAAGVIHEPGTGGDIDEGFEATPEELAAQQGRRQPDDEADDAGEMV